MPVFTSLGLALGATAVTATAVGIGATALAVGAGVGAYALAGGFDSTQGASQGPIDSRVSAATDTGALTEAEAQTAAKKRAFRSGVLFTSPTGLDTDPRTSSAKLR